MDEPVLTEGTLHIAGTRPAMIYGFPWELFTPLFVVTAELAVLKWWWAVFMAPVWGACYLIVKRDYNAPRVWRLWVQHAAFDLHGQVWGGASVSPFSLRLTRHYRGTPPHV